MPVTTAGAPLLLSGHPSDAYGWAIGAGLKLNAPMIGQGDYLQMQVNYTEGALRYLFMTPNSNWGKVEGATEGFGILTDGVFGGTLAGGNATSVELTTAWGFNAAFEHYWNKKWQTSLYGGYSAVSYNSTAQSLIWNGNPASVPAAGFDMDWSTWYVGSRTQYNVDSQTSIGLDVLYSKLQTASFPVALLLGFQWPSAAPRPFGRGQLGSSLPRQPQLLSLIV